MIYIYILYNQNLGGGFGKKLFLSHLATQQSRQGVVVFKKQELTCRTTGPKGMGGSIGFTGFGPCVQT